MDPRHPELSMERIDQLMAQYKGILNKMRVCNVSADLGKMEREGGLVVQEICLVAPRLHEAMIQVSRTRRSAIAHGIVELKHEEEIVEKPVENPERYTEMAEVLDHSMTKEQEQIFEEMAKPKKKTTRKKKTTKKVKQDD